MDLKWTPPKKDNGSEIASYVIEKRDKYGYALIHGQSRMSYF